MSESLQCSKSTSGSLSIVEREKGKDCEQGSRARAVSKRRSEKAVKARHHQGKGEEDLGILVEEGRMEDADVCDNEG